MSSRERFRRTPRAGIFGMLVIIIFLAVTIIPLLWLLMSSFKTNAELFASPFAPPARWSLTNYLSAFAIHPLTKYLRNSVFTSAVSTLVALAAGTLASYALLHKFRLRGQVYLFLIFGLLLPVNAFIGPIFYLVHFLGLYDTVAGLSLAYAGISFPLGFLIVKTYMDTIPGELLEAGRVEGASFHRVFLSVVLPITTPGIVTAAIFLTITSWNELLFASILTQSERSQTIQVGIRYFLTTYSANYPEAFAATVMAIVPTVLVYVFLSDRVISGMTAGSIK